MTRGIEVAICGTATRGTEIRQSKAGNEFAVVSLMTQDGTTDADGKPTTVFVKALAFGANVATGRTIRKGDRVYAEGNLSASIWKTAEGEARLDLTIKTFTLLKTGIGKNRPPRGEGRNADTSPPAKATPPTARRIGKRQLPGHSMPNTAMILCSKG